MKKRFNVLIPLITVLILGIISWIVTIANQYYEIHYNLILQLIVINGAFVLAGMLIGLEGVVENYFCSGTWQLKKKRIAFFTLPLLVLYICLIINLFDISAMYHTVLNSFFRQTLGILIGYSVVTSFYKKE